MKIETLNERISNAEEKINKKQNTIGKKTALIEKKKALYAKAGNENERYWITCDINSLEEDIMRNQREINETKESLEKYRAQLTAELEKAASRNVPAILEFLENWKAHVTQYHHDRFPVFLEEREARYEANRKYCDFVNTGWYKIEDREKAAQMRKEAWLKERKADKAFEAKWGFIMRYVNRDEFDDVLLAKDLDYEANAKYDDIIERTNAICGKIIDARGLWVGLKGDLDGIVIGERGKAKVQTIGAGGYNIQCYHFRTLIHELK
jgi:hypothetical protein